MKYNVTGNTYPIKDQLRALGCRWDTGAKAWTTEDESVYKQALALMEPAPIFNSPPPADLGTTDPVALAAKYGRKSVAGAKVESRMVYGLVKGDDGDGNGTIHVVRRKKGQPLVRIVQVARTKRRYFSRDMLEDFDLFGAEPGGSYQWDGVEVEPTEEELTADQKSAEAKEAKERPIRWRKEIERVVRVAANHKGSDCNTSDLKKLWGESRMAGSEAMFGDENRLVYYTSDYDMGPSCWELIDPALASEALNLKVPIA